MEEATSLPGSPRTSAPPIRFLTPPASPRRQRTCSSTPPTHHRTQASRWTNLRKKIGTFDGEAARAPLSPSESDPLPFLDPTKKAWILAAAANDVGKLRGLLQNDPFLLTVSDPYSGYTAMHLAAKSESQSLKCSARQCSHPHPADGARSHAVHWTTGPELA